MPSDGIYKKEPFILANFKPSHDLCKSMQLHTSKGFTIIESGVTEDGNTEFGLIQTLLYFVLFAVCTKRICRVCTVNTFIYLKFQCTYHNF